MTYYGSRLDGFHLPFNFHLMSTPWKPNDIAALIQAYESALPAGAWPNWVLGNHDRSRLASRIGSAQARVAAMLLLTLRGTPTHLSGRRNRGDRRPNSPRSSPRPLGEKCSRSRARPRSCPHPDALGRRHECGLFQRPTLVTGKPKLQGSKCRAAGCGSARYARPLPRAFSAS